MSNDHGLSVGDVVQKQNAQRLDVIAVSDNDGAVTLVPEGKRTIGFGDPETWGAETVAGFIENGDIKVLDGDNDADEFGGTDDLPGRAQAREIGTTLEIRTREAQHGYVADFERGSELVGEMLNISHSAASLSPGATLEFGGDRRKRVTVLDQGASGSLLAVEIGDRD